MKVVQVSKNHVQNHISDQNLKTSLCPRRAYLALTKSSTTQASALITSLWATVSTGLSAFCPRKEFRLLPPTSPPYGRIFINSFSQNNLFQTASKETSDTLYIWFLDGSWTHIHTQATLPMPSRRYLTN